jgi:hypothetical protein
MSAKTKQEPQQPHILRAHRLMEAFAKSDDERDFYLDRQEGFIVFVDLDKPPTEVEELEKELAKNSDRYCMIPKLTFYETKKIMEGFVNEKVYDIDTKEKLLDIIQSKEARTNFLEFIYDHLTELEKWQQYYQERSRIRIIEWLRQNHFNFAFEEDLEFPRGQLEKLKLALFQNKPSKDVLAARKILMTKAKTYYSNEALNPRPKRGRPPKQAVKQEIEPQFTTDIYITVASQVRAFLFTPDISSAASVTFSSSFENPEMVANRPKNTFTDSHIDNFQQKLADLRKLSTKWVKPVEENEDFEDIDSIDDEEDFDEQPVKEKGTQSAKAQKIPAKKAPRASPKVKAKPKPKPKVKAKPKLKPVSVKKAVMRPIIKANNKNIQTTASGKKKHKRIMPVQKPAAKVAPLRKITPVSKTTKVKPKPLIQTKTTAKNSIKPKTVNKKR